MAGQAKDGLRKALIVATAFRSANRALFSIDKQKKIVKGTNPLLRN
jgi:hypothetical protein